jgi:hypothetical protein
MRLASYHLYSLPKFRFLKKIGAFSAVSGRENGEWKIKHIRFSPTMVTPYEDGWVKNPFMA